MKVENMRNFKTGLEAYEELEAVKSLSIKVEVDENFGKILEEVIDYMRKKCRKCGSTRVVIKIAEGEDEFELTMCGVTVPGNKRLLERIQSLFKIEE